MTLGLCKLKGNHKLNVLSKVFDCPPLLALLNIKVPMLGFRNGGTFYCSNARTHIFVNSPVFVMYNNFNKISGHCDTHYDSLKKDVNCSTWIVDIVVYFSRIVYCYTRNAAFYFNDWKILWSSLNFILLVPKELYHF